MKKVYGLAVLCFLCSDLLAQLFVPMGTDAYHWIDRAEIKINNLDTYELHSDVKPCTVVDVLDVFKKAAQYATHLDSLNYASFSDQNFILTNTGKRSKPIAKHFYTQNSALYNVSTEYFTLSINPVINLTGGTESFTRKGIDSVHSVYINTRGIEVQGILDEKVSFYTFLTDNQMRLPLQVKLFEEQHTAIPGESYFKKFKSNGFDFYRAEGYVAMPLTKHITMQFGSSNQFIGDGVRTLIYSDFAKPHLFFKVNTKIWKFNYENLFYELTDSAYITGGSLYFKKFGATHHISLNLTKTFNIGFFESVIFKRDNNAYEVSYLNPLIFYRSVEHGLGSPDNILLGLNFKWNYDRQYQFYAELVLDEFSLTAMRNQFTKLPSNPLWGWWGNKYAGQFGFKYIDVANVDNLDLQTEFTLVRPYTYSYYEPNLDYADFNQSMAHPLGANFYEFYAKIWYQPVPKMQFTAKMFFAQKGVDDTTKVSYGGDITLPNRDRKAIYGNYTTQGVKATYGYLELGASYRIFQLFYFDASFTLRWDPLESTCRHASLSIL